MSAQSKTDSSSTRSVTTITLGLTCWLWDWGRRRTISRLASRTGVNLQLTQHFRGLRREIECVVSGENVDEFVGEFVRHC